MIMDTYRQIPGQDYGILRKKDDREEELFVFGYSCKVYEDYDKSLYIDQGKHLIPWLGDDSLKIDRYDCRGALHDLTPYLPKNEGFDRLVGLSSEEKKIESLCDEERFKALSTNEDEELLYHEEEMKRLRKALNNENTYSEVGFSYGEDSKSVSENFSMKEHAEEEEEEENENEAFIPPYQLDIPVGMKIPKSRKHHEIIEKTANFINDQGTQMEILLKMKQSENPQFNFLSFDNELHPYYRHMMNAIKSGRYKKATSVDGEKSSDTSQSDNLSDDTYLHPSLLPSSSSVSLSQMAPTIPTINYKPSEDCTYSALVSRIKEKQSSIQSNPVKSDSNSNNRISDSNSHSQSVNVSNDSLPLSALTKSARRRRIRKEKEKSKAAISSFNIYYSDEPVTDSKASKNSTDAVAEENVVKIEENNVSEVITSAKLGPVPIPAPIPSLQLPTPEVQLIIDKMAAYVAKNGRDFEEIVRNKNDARFAFLDKTHMYNAFYNQKVELYLQLEYPDKVKKKQVESVKPRIPPVNAAAAAAVASSNVIDKKKSLPKVSTRCSSSSKPISICFSIKKSKDSEGLDIRSSFPYEEGERVEADDEGDPVDMCEERNDNTKDKSLLMSPREITSPERDGLPAKLLTVIKENVVPADKNKEKNLQAERRKKAIEFISLLQRENLMEKHKAAGNTDNKPEPTENTPKETVNGKPATADVITIPSGTSSDSDSIFSIVVSEDTRSKTSKKRARSRSSSAHRDHVSGRDHHRRKHAKSKQRRSSSSHRSRSPSHSRHSSRSKYKKLVKDKSRSKKKKHHRHHHHHHHHHENHKGSQKSSRKTKKFKYTRDSPKESSSSESSSDSETNSRTS